MKRLDFYGREREINVLNDMYETDKFEFVCMYGRRRVGKTTIIQNWANKIDAKVISFTAIEFSERINLNNFTKAIFEILPMGKEYVESFEDWSRAFEYIANHIKDDRIVITIDEYPYLAQSNPSISSIIQKYIDIYFINTRLKIILCGSSMSFMKNQVLGYQSPLYGRRTYQLEIKPFNYNQTAKMRDELNSEEKMLLYAVTGGIPHYINLILPSANMMHDLKKGIEKAFFTNSGSLYEEPTNLIKQELREPAMYNSIIQAIAMGATKMNEIVSKTKEESSKINRYTEILRDLYIIKKETAILNETKRKSIYTIIDNMYLFWYRFVSYNMLSIERGKGSLVFEKIMEDSVLNEYLGKIFERAALDYLLDNEDKFIEFNNIGRWWGNNSITKTEEEIDIVGYNESFIVFAECKYTNKLVDVEIYEDLLRKSKILNQEQKKPLYVIFSKGGFTKKLEILANTLENLKLVTLEDMYK